MYPTCMVDHIAWGITCTKWLMGEDPVISSSVLLCNGVKMGDMRLGLPLPWLGVYGTLCI